MTRLIAWIGLLCVPFFALALIVFRVPSPIPMPEAEIGRCATPCWQGIQPGITTKQVALRQLTSANGFEPFSPECFSVSVQACQLYEWQSPDDVNVSMGIQTQRGVVVSVEAKTPAFTLGEALLSLDHLQRSLYSFQIGHDVDKLYLWLSFSESTISLSAQAACPSSLFALLQTPIDTVAIQSPSPSPQHTPMDFILLRRIFYHLCET